MHTCHSCSTMIYVAGMYMYILIICTYVIGFAKRGLIHASDFAILMGHNFICGSAMKLKFIVNLV